MNAPTGVGGNVWRARGDKGWSTETLASKAGVSAGAVSMVENGHRQPTVTTLVKLSRALGTTPSELLRGVE